MSMFRHQAIYNTHSNVVGVNEHRGAIDKDDNIVTLDEDKVAEEEAKLQTEYDSKKYQRDRAVAYPSYADQLDTIYHQGLDAWKAEIKAIKDAHPKPE